MPKTSYPTTIDLALYLHAAGLLADTTVTTGAASATQTVGSTTDWAKGDMLVFVGAGVTRTIASVTSSTVVVVDSSVTTTTGERVLHVPAGLDLATAVTAGINDFEVEVGRKMLATADTTRRFDPPAGQTRSLLDLKSDLAAITSVTVNGTAQVLNTDYFPLPENADEEGRPWFLIEFAARWYGPLTFADRRTVVIVGRWGYASDSVGMPEAAWTAMLAAAALTRIKQLAQALAGGLTSWSQAEVSESYGNDPLSGLAEGWKAQFDSAVARYRRRMVG